MTCEDEYGDEGYTVVGSDHYTTYTGHGALFKALFFALGCAVGAGIVLLAAPQSGSKIRRQLREASLEARDKVGSSRRGRVLGVVGATLNKGKELVKEQKPLLAAAVEAGRTAYKKERAERKARKA